MDLRGRRHSGSKKEEKKDTFFAILFNAREAGAISSLTGIHSNWNSFTAGWSVKHNSVENMLVDNNKVKPLPLLWPGSFAPRDLPKRDENICTCA